MPRLLPNFLTLCQRIQDCSTKGFRLYVTGQIDPEKWPKFEAKMVSAYELDMSDSTRSKRRKKGESVARLYACPVPGGAIQWVMMVTEGAGRIHSKEDLQHIETNRLEIGGFELVHDGVGWTWKMTAARFKYWKDRILTIAKRPPERRKIVINPDTLRQHDAEIETVMDTLYSSPGFRLVRRQVGQLVAHANASWTRFRPSSGPSIRKRSYLPYVRRLPNVKVQNDI
jgi:hypothetical protein